MCFKKAFLCLLMLICPCAFCYGQVGFSGVNGERGYAAMRGIFKWDSDRGILLAPSYEYYRTSDEEDVEKTGTTHRYGLQGAYEVGEDWKIFAGTFWQPTALGYKAVHYHAGVAWQPFYRYGILKNPELKLRVGQGRYKTYVDTAGTRLGHPLREIDTRLGVEIASDVGRWNLQGSWQKVLKYSNPVPQGVSFSWADIPFMTAVVQGFLREAAALRISYPTRLLTPYATWVRYQYAETSNPAAAVNAGLKLRWGETEVSGGVEVFEPRREANRKTYFSMSVEVKFE